MTRKTGVKGSETGRFGLAVGPWTTIAASDGRAVAAIGGEPPTRILIFPHPRWELVDDEPGNALITDDESQAAIVAHWKKHGVDIVIDYEHESTSGRKAVASGWIKSLEAAGEKGLLGSVEWTEDAQAEIRKGQYRYHSPVAIYDKKSRRVVALHSVALTNTPRTNHQAPITEQVAASLIANFERKSAKGGTGMRDWMQSLIYFMNLPATSKPEEVREHAQRMVDSIGTESAEAADKPKEGATIAAAIGFVPETELAARVEAALKEKGEIVASAEVLTLLGVEASADLATVTAALIQLRHPEGMVSAEEHAKVLARLAELDETAKTDRVEKLLASNATKLTPATKEEFRKIANSNFALAEATLAKMPELRSQGSVSAATAPPAEPQLETKEATIETAEGERRVDPEKAAIAARNREIMKEKDVSYAEANTIRLKEQRTAK